MLLRPLPLFPLRPLLDRIVLAVAEKHPRLFRRLGEHSQKIYAIAPTDLPLVFVLQPDPEYPILEPERNLEDVSYDALVSGPFMKLMDLVEGRLDGDAMFFSRDLTIEGDTEAVLALRNALDDIDGNIVDDIVESLGILSLPARQAVVCYRKLRARASNDA